MSALNREATPIPGGCQDVLIERVVQERTAQLEQRNSELDAFARHLAHELRTPIGQVTAIAQRLLDDPAGMPDPRNRAWLQLQIDAARRMDETLLQLLE